MKELLSKENIDSTLRRIIIIISTLFPISTIVQTLIPILNKLIFIILILFLVIYLIKNLPSKKNIIFLIIFFISYLISFLFINKDILLLNINMAIYLPFTVLYFIFIMENKNKLIIDIVYLRKYIFKIVVLYICILVIAIFDPSSYRVVESGGWGDSKYFLGYSDDPGRFGSSAMFISILLILLCLCNYFKKLLIFFNIPLIYVAFFTGSRTYLVLILLCVLIFYYIWLDNKKIFYYSLIPILIVGIIVFFHSNMFNKISSTYNFSNGRNIMWKERIKEYLSFPIINKIFGHGVNYSLSLFGYWSHNDFIEIGLSYGLMGVLSYLYLMYIFIKDLLKNNYKLIIIISIFIWLFNACVNFFYCYLCANLSYPILLLVLAIYKIKMDYSKKES